MKKLFQLLIVALVGISSQAFADGDHSSHGGVAAAKAAELALHRVGKLVDLQKIDASFVSGFQAVQVVSLPMGDASGAAYKAVVYQSSNAAQRASVEILLDMAGKALSHKVVGTASAGGAPHWPSQDALTLAENSFHWVLDNGTSASVQPFYKGFTDMNLTAGNNEAVATFRSSQTSHVLIVHVNFDGAVTSTEIQ